VRSRWALDSSRHGGAGMTCREKCESLRRSSLGRAYPEPAEGRGSTPVATGNASFETCRGFAGAGCRVPYQWASSHSKRSTDPAWRGRHFWGVISGQEFIPSPLPSRGEAATLWKFRGEGECGSRFGVH